MASPGAWTPLERQLKEFESAVRRTTARHINAAALLEVAKELVRDYFRSARPRLEEGGVSRETLGALDATFQRLLELTNRRSLRSAYLSLLRDLTRSRASAEIEFERHQPESPTVIGLASTERAILERLSSTIPSAALGYHQAVQDLQSGTKISWRGTAAELREAAREALDNFAPDADVMAVAGFRLEAGQTRPTMTQKMRYVIRKRNVPTGAQAAPEDVAKLIETTAGLARSAYTRGAVATHTSPSRAEVRQLKRYVDTLLCELLEIDA